MGSSDLPEVVAVSNASISRAAALILAGQPVAVPTETVYGLAARADQDAAVAEVYRAKGRPDFNPLIVHVPSLDLARNIAEFDERAESLARKFWPGPLTLVLPLKQGAPISAAVTAGLPTIAIRVPAHEAMRRVLMIAGVPLAAPSANKSGGVSPTTAEHVAASLNGRIPLVLDGGTCAKGLESTIVALRSSGEWQLLRPGPISVSEIQAVCGLPVPVANAGIEAPGQLASHYAPGKPVRLEAKDARGDEFLIGFGALQGDCNLSPDGDLAEAASTLYSCLHQAAASEKPKVAVASIPETGIGIAINDRLRRAAA